MAWVGRTVWIAHTFEKLQIGNSTQETAGNGLDLDLGFEFRLEF